MGVDGGKTGFCFKNKHLVYLFIFVATALASKSDIGITFRWCRRLRRRRCRVIEVVLVNHVYPLRLA